MKLISNESDLKINLSAHRIPNYKKMSFRTDAIQTFI